MNTPRLRARLLVAALSLAVLPAACGPADGVLSYTFVLAAPSSVALPTRQELDLPLDALAYAAATGKVAGNPDQGALDVTVTGLPPLGVPREKAYYQLVVTAADTAITPRASASLRSRLLRALWPIHEAWAHGEESTVPLHLFDTDAFGRAHLSGSAAMVRIDAIEAAQVDLVIPLDTVHVKRFQVLAGVIGNLPSTGGAPATNTPTGHQH